MTEFRDNDWGSKKGLRAQALVLHFSCNSALSLLIAEILSEGLIGWKFVTDLHFQLSKKV